MAQTLEHNGSVTQVVPVEIPFCDVDVEVIQKLDDEPNDVGGLSAQELKERFDHVGGELKSYLNEKLIPTVVSDDLTEQTRQEAEAERVKNERERVENEAERAEAETARGAAETVRNQAEEGRKSAESQRETTEAARAASEQARATAETARAGAEKDREGAEAARVAAEAARAAAETGRETAETGRATAEEARESAETARAEAEAARVAAEEQRADTDAGIVAQATAQASLAAGSAQAAETAKTGAETAQASAEAAKTSAETAQASAEAAKTSAETARAAAEEEKASAEAAKTGAETALASAEEYAGQAGESAQAAAASAAQAGTSASLSTSEADRAKREADRAKAISGGDFVTPVELEEAVGVKANIPLVGTEEDLETLGVGGVLLVTDGGGEGAKARQIGVKGADGTLQVVELGGSGGKRVNGGGLVQEIKINAEGKFVKPGGRTLSWAEVEALTPNTGVAPTAAEKEMFKAEDGSYTLERMVYDGYISKEQAVLVMALGVEAVAMEPDSQVTIYDKSWGKVTNDGSSVTAQVMNANALPFFGGLRAGMDDMEVAVNGEPVDYDAQQRVYFEVERKDGSAVDYCVLVIHLAGQENNNVGVYDYASKSIGVDGKVIRGGKFPDKVNPEGTAPTVDGYAIWIYPEGTDLSICPPNAEVTLWSDEVKALIDAGTTDGLTKDQISTVNTFGAADKWGHHYPMAFRVSVPCCEMLHIKMLTEDPLSAVGYITDSVENPVRPKIFTWWEGKLDEHYDYYGHFGRIGENIQLYGGVRTQMQNMDSANENKHRGFTISVEFETPKVAEALAGSGASITFPSGSGKSVYTISDGTDVQSGSVEMGKLFTVLRHCNATYEARVTVGGKTYTAQIVTGPYYGEITLGAEAWTEVTEQ